MTYHPAYPRPADLLLERDAEDRDMRALAALAKIQLAAKLFASILESADEIDHPHAWRARESGLDFMRSYIEDLDGSEHAIRNLPLCLEGVE